MYINKRFLLWISLSLSMCGELSKLCSITNQSKMIFLFHWIVTLMSVCVWTCVRARICFIFRFVFLSSTDGFWAVCSFLLARTSQTYAHTHTHIVWLLDDTYRHTTTQTPAHSDFDFVMKWRRAERNREKISPILVFSLTVPLVCLYCPIDGAQWLCFARTLTALPLYPSSVRLAHHTCVEALSCHSGNIEISPRSIKTKQKHWEFAAVACVAHRWQCNTTIVCRIKKNRSVLADNYTADFSVRPRP